MKRKISVWFVFMLWCIVGFAENTREKDYILILNSVNFDEAWTNNLYQEILSNFSSKDVDVQAEELLVPMVKTLEEAAVKREDLLQKYPTPPKVVVFIGCYVVRYLTRSGRIYLRLFVIPGTRCPSG